jgi:hypothetical protein
MIRKAVTDLLHVSGLIQQIEELTRDLIKKYKIYGDYVFQNLLLFQNLTRYKAIGGKSFFHIKPLALK